MLILSISLVVVVFIVSVAAIRNLLIKVEKYEDITADQAQYLQNISNLIADSQKHLKSLDERGVFQSDDEVGYFFEQMQNVQNELDRYMLPENYGEKKIKE